MITKQLLSHIETNKGNNLSELSHQHHILLVFLRHFGCVYCKESMYDISKQRNNIERQGIKIILVHMADHETASAYFKKFKIDSLEQIADPECKVYSSFGLVKGTVSQLFGLKTWLRTAEIAATKQLLPSSKRIGDGLQMPGIFLLKDDAIIDKFIHLSVADRPNYDVFIKKCQNSC